jgi:hypothetical protein
MSLIRIDRNPSRGQLAIFALLWLVVFGGMDAVAWHHAGPAPAAWLFGAAAVLAPLLGCLSVRALRLVYLAAAYATFPIGLVVSFVILLAVFYLVVTPLGLLLRLLGHDAMKRRFDRDASTYWSPRKPAESVQWYFRQF